MGSGDVDLLVLVPCGRTRRFVRGTCLIDEKRAMSDLPVETVRRPAGSGLTSHMSTEARVPGVSDRCIALKVGYVPMDLGPDRNHDHAIAELHRELAVRAVPSGLA
jgi:hypothetical protein